VPVETGRSGGEFTRHYRGGTHLGIALQWDCPACGTKHETANAPIEQGCPACGAGVPGVAGKAAATSSPTAPGVSPVAPQSALREAGASVRAPGQERSAKLTLPEGQEVQTVYRLVRYTGSKAWIEATLRRSLVGYMDLGEGLVTATIVDSVDRRQEDLLGMAGRQPGVWRAYEDGRPELAGFDSRRGLTGVPRTHRVGGREGSLPSPVVRTSPVTPTKETAPVPTINPTAVMATELIDALGSFQGAYTVAMALNQFATVVEDESMERDKYWSPQQCLGVAQALLELIPKDWQPEPEPDESQNPPQTIGDI